MNVRFIIHEQTKKGCRQTPIFIEFVCSLDHAFARVVFIWLADLCIGIEINGISLACEAAIAGQCLYGIGQPGKEVRHLDKRIDGPQIGSIIKMEIGTV